MPWFAVDDTFPEHEKLEALESEPLRYMAAVTVWCVMGADCARRLTDGLVTRARLRKVVNFLGRHATIGVDTLVSIGLWDICEDGWAFHDWKDYQPTKDEVLASRALKSERQRRWRNKSRDATVDASTAASRVAAPSHPLPSPPIPSQKEGESPLSGKRQIGSAHIDELVSAIGEVAFELDITPPRPTRDQTWQIAERVAEMSRKRGVTYREAALALAAAAFEAGGKVAFNLLEIDPYAGGQAGRPQLSAISVAGMDAAKAREAAKAANPEHILRTAEELEAVAREAIARNPKLAKVLKLGPK